MKHVRFEAITDQGDLALNFGCRPADVSRLTGPDQARLYEPIWMPKKGATRRGQFRVVYKVVDRTLRLLQKNIASAIAERVAFPEYVQGFVARRSIVTNAGQHLAKRLVLTADIEKFFESIDIERVAAAFLALGCAGPIAELLAKLTTLDGRLVQGSSASPIIANLVCQAMDRDFAALADEHSAKYTRYADDITLSSDRTVPGQEEIVAILTRHGFGLRDGRVRVQRRGRRQYVTGLSVFDGERPRLPRSTKRRLRLVLHYASKHGLRDHFEKVGIAPEDQYIEARRIEGWIQFMRSVEPRVAGDLEGKYHEARLKDGSE